MNSPNPAGFRLVPSALRKPLFFRLARLTILCLGLSLLYGWAAPRAYPPDTQFGLEYGILHGALMPMALPSLIMGKDVTIYCENNDGRRYKIGYILGINLCGLLVFGTAFLRINRKFAPLGPTHQTGDHP